jgi:hypothetical protein
MDSRDKNVSILLTEALLECLKAHAAEGSVAAQCLDRAVDVQDVFTATPLAYSVSGSAGEITAVLDLASRHCGDAVADIRDSLWRFTSPT